MYNEMESKNTESAQMQEAISKIKMSNEYVLQPGDLIEIKMFREGDMDRTIRINSNGTITYPMVGNIKIAGQSLDEAEKTLSEALKKYYLNPSLTIFIKEYGNKTIYVLGQVEKPSAIQMPPEKTFTVLEAISSAGGFTKIAAPSKVKVLRTEKNGEHKTIEIDVSQITKQGDKSLDISLMPGDVIFVPQSVF